MSDAEEAPVASSRDGPDESVAAVDAEAVSAARAALDELPDGSGCTEIWDHLSARRRD